MRYGSSGEGEGEDNGNESGGSREETSGADCRGLPSDHSGAAPA